MPLSGRKSAALSYALASMRAPAWLAAPRRMVSVIACLPCGRVGRPRTMFRRLAAVVLGHPCYAGRATLARMDEGLLARLHRGRDGLAATRDAVEAAAPWPLAATFDTSEEAQWGPPEVLAHVEEMVPYWL